MIFTNFIFHTIIQLSNVSSHEIGIFSDSTNGWIKYLSWEDEQLTGDVVLRKRRRYCLLDGTGTSSSCLFEEQGRYSIGIILIFLFLASFIHLS